jgi:hypothetical protein
MGQIVSRHYAFRPRLLANISEYLRRSTAVLLRRRLIWNAFRIDHVSVLVCNIGEQSLNLVLIFQNTFVLFVSLLTSFIPEGEWTTLGTPFDPEPFSHSQGSHPPQFCTEARGCVLTSRNN